ncbi:MAG: DUF3108 domain-containing protein [Candidatus Omnitrophica bacterium]|nr:DUF3108 domain-containing protein [Candidatus Omnitrophota bacterium]
MNSQIVKKIINLIKKELYTVGLYLLLSIYATFPLIFNLKTCFYGTKTDPLAWFWGFWWLKFAHINGLSADFVPILAVPFGVKYPALYPLWNIFNLYSTILVGEIVTYNLQSMCSFFLSAVAMYWLVLYFTKNRFSAFFSGIVFSLSPYHFARSWDHLCLSSMQWMVVYIISLFNFFAKRNYISALICGFCFALIGQFSNYYYVYFMGIFTILFFVFCIIYGFLSRQRISIKDIFLFFKLSIVGLSTGALIMLLQIWPYLKMVFFSTGEAKEKGLIRSFGQLFADSARPLNYFLPTEYHPVFGKITSFFVGTPLYGENSGGEQSLYLGLIPIFLAYFGYKKLKKDKKEGISDHKTDFFISFWVFILFSFMICSFSPYIGNINGFFIPLPSFFLFKIFPIFRNYARMGSVVMISICVLAGFGLKYCLEKFNTQRKKLIIVIILCLIVIFEFANFSPSRIVDISHPPEVYTWLKRQPEDSIIAEYPLKADMRPVLFNQTIHHKKMINGAVPGTNAYEISQKIKDLEADTTPGILSFLGVNYILVHKDKYLNYEGGMVLGQVPDLSDNPGFNHLKDFGDTVVYEVVANPINPDNVTIAPKLITFEAENSVDNQHYLNMNFKFKQGNDFKYNVKYLGFIKILNLDMSLEQGQLITENKTMLIKLTALPSRLLGYFLKGKAQLQSLFDIDNFYNYEYEELVQLKNKVKEKNAIFDRKSNIMSTKDRQVQIEPYTQDPISAIFFLASQQMLVNKKIMMYINPGKSNYKLELVIDSQEEIRIDKEVYRCWKLKGELLKIKDINKKIADITLWFNVLGKQELIKLEAMTKAGLVTLEKQ